MTQNTGNEQKNDQRARLILPVLVAITEPDATENTEDQTDFPLPERVQASVVRGIISENFQLKNDLAEQAVTTRELELEIEELNEYARDLDSARQIETERADELASELEMANTKRAQIATKANELDRLVTNLRQQITGLKTPKKVPRSRMSSKKAAAKSKKK